MKVVVKAKLFILIDLTEVNAASDVSKHANATVALLARCRQSCECFECDYLSKPKLKHR